jgi:ribosomal protein S18 acetylase RimI-like enzyme
MAQVADMFDHTITAPEDAVPDWEKLRTIKRYRMECPLEVRHSIPPLPAFRPFRPELLNAHADVLFQAFVDSPDLGLFPGLGSFFGCQAIMEAIAAQPSFLPSATLLALDERHTPIASIQAISQRQEGLIMNIGVVPKARGKGWARGILTACLEAMAGENLGFASLEVSGVNQAALRLYTHCGFRKTRVQYLPLQDLNRPDRPGFWDLPLDLW